MLTVARRVASLPIFRQTPQQSDYVRTWQATAAKVNSTEAPREKSSRDSLWRRHMPDPMKRTLHSLKSRLQSALQRGFDRRHYRRITEENLLQGKL